MSRIIVLDVDPSSRSASATFVDAGLETELVAPNNLAARVRAFDPHLLWVHADVGTTGLIGVLSVLESVGAAVPVVVVSKDSKDAVWVRQSVTGVVEVLKGPFSASIHLMRLRSLLTELPTRSGTVRGRSAGKDFGLLFQHLEQTRRDAQLAVAEGTAAEAHLWFLKGRLKDATGGGLKGQPVLAQLLALTTTTPWTLVDGKGADRIVEMESLQEEDEPFVVSTQQHDEPPHPPPPPSVPPAVAPVGPRPSRPAPGSTDSPFGAAVNTSVVSGPPPPLVPPVAAPRPEAEAPGAAETPLLFVDDDEAIVRMFASYFSKRGYPVAVARDGVEAMQVLSATRCEVVIADLNMPRLDGWGLLKALREDFRTQELMVALFSAHDDYREQLRAMHAGAQAYYSKGLKLNALELQVRELCEPRRRFRRLLEQHNSVTLSLSSLGPQWILRTLAASSQSVQLDAFDGWSTWRLFFSRGQLIDAQARTGSQSFPAWQALRALLCSRSLEGSLAFVEPQAQHSFGGQSTEQLLTRAVAELNEEQRQARDELLRSAQKLEVNTELYHLYVAVGPPGWQPIVKALCEEKLLPREVMQRMQVTPQEMGALLKDLLRRGVVTLTP